MRVPESLKFKGCFVFMTYASKLKDPRWQKKRLQALERDCWMCQLCQDKTTTLHIHHYHYAASGNPWDSELDDLTTYCKHCHAFIEFDKSGTHHPYQVIKLEIAKDLFALAVFFLCENHIFNLYYYDEVKENLSYITTLPCDFIKSIDNHFTLLNNILNG